MCNILVTISNTIPTTYISRVTCSVYFWHFYLPGKCINVKTLHDHCTLFLWWMQSLHLLKYKQTCIHVHVFQKENYYTVHNKLYRILQFDSPSNFLNYNYCLIFPLVNANWIGCGKTPKNNGLYFNNIEKYFKENNIFCRRTCSWWLASAAEESVVTGSLETVRFYTKTF